MRRVAPFRKPGSRVRIIVPVSSVVAWTFVWAFAWANVGRAEWSAAAGCLDQEGLRVLVESALNEEIPSDVTIDGEIVGRARAWRADLRVSSERGEARSRVLTSEDESCHHFDDAIGVVTALLVDEVRGVQEPASLAVPPRAEGPSWMAIVRIAGLARIDAMPGLAGALGLEVEVRAPMGLSLMLGLAGWPEVSAITDGVGGRFVAMSASLGGCYASGVVDGLELGGCLAMSGTLLRGDGIGLSIPASSEGFLLDLGLDALIRLRIVDRMWARLALGAAVPLIRPRSMFRTEMGEHVIHEVALVIPEGSLGIEARFD